MDKRFVDSGNLVEKYVRDELSGEQLDAFEIFLLEHPEYLDDINAAEQLRNTLRHERDTLFTDTTTSEPTRLPQRSTYAIAATIMLGLALAAVGFGLAQRSELTRQIAVLKQPRGLTQQIWIDQTRGATAPTFLLTKHQSVLLHVETGPSPASLYSISLSLKDASQIGSVFTVEPSRDNVLPIYLPNIEPGHYQLEATPVSRSEADALRYEFILKQELTDTG